MFSKSCYNWFIGGLCFYIIFRKATCWVSKHKFYVKTRVRFKFDPTLGRLDRLRVFHLTIFTRRLCWIEFGIDWHPRLGANRKIPIKEINK